MDYLKLVLETIKDRVYVLRDDGEIIFVTQSMMKAFGYGASEVIGRKIYELADEEYRERVVETLKSLEDGDEVKMRLLVKRKDGKRVWAGVIAKNWRVCRRFRQGDFKYSLPRNSYESCYRPAEELAKRS